MGLSTAGKNWMLDWLGKTSTGATNTVADMYVSLHTADPGDTGSNEVSDDSPSLYARKLITFSNSSSGAIDSSNTPQFDVPASTTITHVGMWKHATDEASSHFLGSANITNETFGGAGTYTLTDFDISLS